MPLKHLKGFATQLWMDTRDIHAIAISLENWATGPSTVSGARLDYIKSELMAPGEISFTSDPQLGKVQNLEKNREVAPIFSSCGIMMNYGYLNGCLMFMDVLWFLNMSFGF